MTISNKTSPVYSSRQAQSPNSSASWLGMLGGGQLGRMFVHAAQAMGYKVAVLEPEADCPASHAADKHIRAGYEDLQGLAELVALCPSITTEFENVPAKSLAWLEKNRFVSPSSACVSIAQDRQLEKAFFQACADKTGVFAAPNQSLRSIDDVNEESEQLVPGILKTARMGYDGKGQVRVKSRTELIAALVASYEIAQRENRAPEVFVLEKLLPLAYEISVLVARGADGATAVYPIAENVHRDGILFTTTVPSPNVSDELAKKAQGAAQIYISELQYVGVLCIEFFVLQDGRLVVNEMAPRPHNSGHYTIDACASSQFEQQVRTMAGMPLGDVAQHSPCVMLNLLGDIWFRGDEMITPAWHKILALPSAHLHLYGKSSPRRARKMGHITFVSKEWTQVHTDLRAACDLLGIEHA
ncbi:MAG: 5-(carboxyamino)imidazole ribonucleotide synthase [Burkholderiaceae bacterium]|nr:5-(carboxyamino)imidazole ribonucleotide synthase [Burkholderiaceae bacterium]